MQILATYSQPAFEEIRKVTEYKWSSHQFATYCKNHYITNNLSESFNAWILDARSLPAVDLVDKLGEKLLYKFEQRRAITSKWKVTLVSYVDRYVKDIRRKLGVWSIRWTH